MYEETVEQMNAGYLGISLDKSTFSLLKVHFPSLPKHIVIYL
jgi:hypothetical protein